MAAGTRVQSDILLPPKPWLALLRTDFAHLRQLHSAQFAPQPSPPSSPTTTDAATTPASHGDLGDAATDTATPSMHVLSLPAEVMRAIFSFLEPEHLSSAAQVCRAWLPFAYEPHQWRRICRSTWPHEPAQLLERRLYKYKSWRKLATTRPRLRANAIYVLRHQFAKTATRTATTEPMAPVFLVTFHRLLRFYPDGTVVALTTPEPPHLAYRRMQRTWSPRPHERNRAPASIGRYHLDEGTGSVHVQYPMSHPGFPAMESGTIVMCFQLRESREGAFDRLLLTKHYAFMDDNDDNIIVYNVDRQAKKPFKLVPIWGFGRRVYEEFPRDDDNDLATWFEMKRASRMRVSTGDR